MRALQVWCACFAGVMFTVCGCGVRALQVWRAYFAGVVYQNIVNAHDLLTAWLRKDDQPECDHYALLTG